VQTCVKDCLARSCTRKVHLQDESFASLGEKLNLERAGSGSLTFQIVGPEKGLALRRFSERLEKLITSSPFLVL
jgi:hypothetical protein